LLNLHGFHDWRHGFGRGAGRVGTTCACKQYPGDERHQYSPRISHGGYWALAVPFPSTIVGDIRLT
jgi:hypothetical protein